MQISPPLSASPWVTRLRYQGNDYVHRLTQAPSTRKPKWYPCTEFMLVESDRDLLMNTNSTLGEWARLENDYASAHP